MFRFRGFDPERVFALSVLLLAGCGPALKQDVRFTPRVVHTILFDDVCRLQRYFDTEQPEYKQTSHYVINTSAHRANGALTYLLAPGPQSGVFTELVRRLYTRLPEFLDESRRLEVTIEYYTTKTGKRTYPVGGKTTVDVGTRSMELPYHPCLGAFFFGEEHYRARRKLRGSVRGHESSS